MKPVLSGTLSPNSFSSLKGRSVMGVPNYILQKNMHIVFSRHITASVLTYDDESGLHHGFEVCWKNLLPMNRLSSIIITSVRIIRAGRRVSSWAGKWLLPFYGRQAQLLPWDLLDDHTRGLGAVELFKPSRLRCSNGHHGSFQSTVSSEEAREGSLLQSLLDPAKY